LRDTYRVTIRRACQVISISESVYHYKSHRQSDTALGKRIKEIASTRVHYGYQRIHILLRCEGWHVNHKKVHRIYKDEGLNLRSKRPRRRVAPAHRLDRPEITAPDQCWSMDSEFISKVLDKWAYENNVVLDFSRPGHQQIIHLLNRLMVASEMNV